MKTGKSITELAAEIARQANSRHDYIADTRTIGLDAVGGGDIVLDMADHGPAPLNDLAHGQIADHVGIPAKYYNRMRAESAELLTANVNHWFAAQPQKRMIRTLDTRVRAFLSDRYRALENHDLAEAVLPVIAGRGLEVMSCEMTERRLYIKAVDASVVREINGRRIVDGRSVDFDSVSPSVVISNSEVGVGALSVELGMYTHDCRNMALFRDKSLRKYHVGARLEAVDGVVAMLSDRTQRLTDAAIWSQVRDVVAGALNPDHFEGMVGEIRGMREQRITSVDIPKVVEVASKRFDLQEGEKKSVLRHLIEGGDLSRYGLFNALTRTAEDAGDYDRATDLERVGGQLIELPSNDWRRIAEAA